MDVLVIEPNSDDNLQLLIELAKKLGSKVITIKKAIKKEDAEDLALLALMKEEKTGELVSRDLIMDKLKS